MLKTWFIIPIAAVSCAFGSPSRASFQRALIVIFENTDYRDAIQQPFFAQLAQQGVSFGSFLAEAHPSQGNYIALTSGSTQGVDDDGDIDLDVRHIGDLLEENGLSWKVYAENYPGDCFTGTRSGTYVRKHNPFISYTNVQSSAERCARIVDAGQLDRDIATGELPDYALYIPDLNDDGHDTGVEYANNWFADSFGPRLEDPRFRQGTLLITTFDESGSNHGPNQIYTSFYGDSVIAGAGTMVSQTYTHLNILRTIEDRFELGTLGQQDSEAEPIIGIWN